MKHLYVNKNSIVLKEIGRFTSTSTPIEESEIKNHELDELHVTDAVFRVNSEIRTKALSVTRSLCEVEGHIDLIVSRMGRVLIIGDKKIRLIKDEQKKPVNWNYYYAAAVGVVSALVLAKKTMAS